MAILAWANSRSAAGVLVAMNASLSLSLSWHFQSIYRGFRPVLMWFFLCYTKKSSQLRLTIYQCIAIVSKLRFVLLDLNKKRNGMEWNEKKCVFVEYEISYHQNIMIQINQKQKHCIKWNAIVTRSICVMCMWHRELSIRSRIPQKRTSKANFLSLNSKSVCYKFITQHTSHFSLRCVCVALANLHFCCTNMKHWTVDMKHGHCSSCVSCIFALSFSLSLCATFTCSMCFFFDFFFCSFSLFIHNSERSTHTFVCYGCPEEPKRKKTFPNESLGKQMNMRGKPFYRT